MKTKHITRLILLTLISALLILTACGKTNTGNTQVDSQIGSEIVTDTSSEEQTDETEKDSETETESETESETETESESEADSSVPSNSETTTPSTGDSTTNDTPSTDNSNTNDAPSKDTNTPSQDDTSSGNTSTDTTPATYTAMSFNIYVATPDSQRELSVLQTIQKYMPDTLGVQEASSYWMSYLSQKLGGTYAYVGTGRDGDSNSEHSAIFYKKDRFDLISSGTKWLSSTPDIPSRIGASNYNRIFTYALLQDKSTKQQVMVINTHLDNSGTAAREQQADILLKYVKECMTQYPVILTGDFNDIETSTMYKNIKAVLADSSRIAKRGERCYTFHNYGEAYHLFDYIFVSPESITIPYYKVITDEENGMLPSDHYPVYIEYQITN